MKLGVFVGFSTRTPPEVIAPCTNNPERGLWTLSRFQEETPFLGLSMWHKNVTSVV